MIALKLKAGAEVILPAFTFPATAHVVELVGAKSVFVDINMSDFCIDVTKIEQAVTSKTKAIMPVHEFGQSPDIGKIIEIAHKHNLYVIEDAACALGTEYNGKKCGTFGEIGCFSLHPRKAITSGEGGIVVTNNDEIAKKIKCLRNHGIDYSSGSMDFICAGFNYRMTDFQAALCIEQLNTIEHQITHRISIAQIYNELLKKIKWIKTPDTFSNRKMVYQTYHVLIDEQIDRSNLIAFLRNNDIETNLGAQALNCLSYYKNKYQLNDNSFVCAEKAFKYGLALPIGNHIKKADIDYIILKLLNYKN